MFNMFYSRYKVWFWSILSFLFLTGSISKYFTGSIWEFWLNGGLGLVCLVVMVTIVIKDRKK